MVKKSKKHACSSPGEYDLRGSFGAKEWKTFLEKSLSTRAAHYHIFIILYIIIFAPAGSRDEQQPFLEIKEAAAAAHSTSGHRRLDAHILFFLRPIRVQGVSLDQELSSLGNKLTMGTREKVRSWRKWKFYIQINSVHEYCRRFR